MELRRYLSILRRRLWLIALLALFGALGGFIATPKQAKYSTSATIYIGASSFQLNSPSGVQSGADQQLLAADLIPTYSKMLGSQPIAEAAARKLTQQSGYSFTVQEVLSRIKVSTDVNTTLITVDATDASPTVAERIANSVADAFTAKIQSLSPSSGQGSVPTAPAYVFQRASRPTAPISSGVIGNVIKGALAGVIVAMGLAGLLDYIDLRLKSPDDAKARTGLTVLGVIPLQTTDA